MQREIKFRAWIAKEKRMIYLASDMTSGTHMQINNHSWGVFEPDKEDYYGVATANNHRGDILMQYTGLKDGRHADGKEIYPGDICKDNKGDMVVIEWNDNKAMFSSRIIKGGALAKGLRFPLWQWNECEMNGYRYLEVIGNIYENPELLESEV